MGIMLVKRITSWNLTSFTVTNEWINIKTAWIINGRIKNGGYREVWYKVTAGGHRFQFFTALMAKLSPLVRATRYILLFMLLIFETKPFLYLPLSDRKHCPFDSFQMVNIFLPALVNLDKPLVFYEIQHRRDILNRMKGLFSEKNEKRDNNCSQALYYGLWRARC